MVKTDKVEVIYGMRNNKAKRSIASHKSSSMKASDHGGDANKQNGAKLSFEDYMRKNKNSKEVSLPYIQNSHSANPQTNSFVNSKDIKWSPSKLKDKKIVGEHNLINDEISSSKNGKDKRNKVEVRKIDSLTKNNHKFVAIYSNSNSWKPKLASKDSFKEGSDVLKSNNRGVRYK